MSAQRGFACIGLDQPQKSSNVGAVLRAAYCYGVAQINIAGCNARDLRAATNTPKAHRHIPTFIVSDPLAYIPHGTQVVAVDLVDGAMPLPNFCHPQRAIYVFGAENDTLSQGVLGRSHHRVMVPTITCMNLAAAVNVVLYDRMAKGSPFNCAYPTVKSGKSYIRQEALA
mgnify:CR=1 FL=1